MGGRWVSTQINQTRAQFLIQKWGYLWQERQSDIYQIKPEADEAARELLEMVLEDISKCENFEIGQHMIIRPDGKAVCRELPPLAQAGLLLQEDFCILANDANA